MTVVEAVEIARHRLAEVLPEYEGANFQLEELETPPSASRWSFTFSAILPSQTSDSYAASLAEVLRGRRISKSVMIDSNTGELIAVKNASA